MTEDATPYTTDAEPAEPLTLTLAEDFKALSVAHAQRRLQSRGDLFYHHDGAVDAYAESARLAQADADRQAAREARLRAMADELSTPYSFEVNDIEADGYARGVAWMRKMNGAQLRAILDGKE